MKGFILLASIALLSGNGFAQNTGINNLNPGSTLTVGGSFAAQYMAVSANTYTIATTDFYIIWSGTAAGTFSLPAAAALNKGRLYKIRNNTALYDLTIAQTGGVLIDGF